MRSEHNVLLTVLSKSADRIRRGRIDIFVDKIDDFVSVIEIKSTDWDRIKPQNRRKNLGSHCRQILRYVDKYLDDDEISVCAGMIYPQSPRTPGLKAEIEKYLNDQCLQVLWYDDP